PGARANFPMALDEAGRRLFVGARSPALMLVYDTDSGKIVAKVPIGGDTDDVFFDAERKRVYVICGEGRIDIFRQEDADHYVREGSVKTAPRARTGLFVPEEARLYVAAPMVDKTPARILVFGVRLTRPPDQAIRCGRWCGTWRSSGPSASAVRSLSWATCT